MQKVYLLTVFQICRQNQPAHIQNIISIVLFNY